MCHFFDQYKDIIIHESGDLPHIHQSGTMQYVTFHLADSLPQAKLQELSEYLKSLERRLQSDDTSEKDRIILRRREEKINQYLDAGYGSCALANREIRKLLVDAFQAVNNKICVIDSYVIMPNHVHMVITPLSDNSVFKIMKAIKGPSAVNINRYLGKSGRFWQREVFDRMVRNDDHLKHIITYIINNPRELPSSKYALYVREGL